MKRGNVIIQFADFFLKSEQSTSDWSRDKGLLTSWYILFIHIIIIFLYSLIQYLLYQTLSKSIELTLISRIIKLVIACSILFSLIYLVFCYYKFTLKKGNKIFFTNIINFYLLGVLIFAVVYILVYKINPNYFVISTKLIPYSETFKIYAGFQVLQDTLKFIFYSAVQSVTGSFYCIKSDSIIVSIFNYLQTLYTMSLISLFVATFVNRNSFPPGSQK